MTISKRSFDQGESFSLTSVQDLWAAERQFGSSASFLIVILRDPEASNNIWVIEKKYILTLYTKRFLPEL